MHTSDSGSLAVVNVDDATGERADAQRGSASAVQVIDLRGGLDDSYVTTAPKRVNPLLSLVVAVSVVWFAVSSGHTTTLLIAGALGFMIFLHELGHFLTARLTGMKATEFFVGFGPRVWSFKRGETEYGIKAIPLGGYVKILGMTNLDKVDDPADEPRTYRQQTYPRRVLVASAGTLMHLLLAFVLFTSVYSGFGESAEVDGQVQIGSVTASLNGVPSPASVAGIKPGEWILSINGQQIRGSETLASVINGSAGKSLAFEIGETVHHTSRIVMVTPVAVAGPTGVIGRIGLADLHSNTVLPRVSLAKGMGHSIRTIRDFAPLTFTALGKFFTPSHIESYSKVIANAGKPNATAPIGENRFMSPLGAVKTVERATGIDFRLGIATFAAINVFVGLFNMVPMLPFDGGHVVVATYERLRSTRRRRHYVDVSRLMPVVYLVVFVLMAIGVSSFYLDVRNPL